MISLKEIKDVLGWGYDKATHTLVNLTLGGVFKNNILIVAVIGVCAVAGVVRTRRDIGIRRHKRTVISTIEKSLSLNSEQENITQNLKDEFPAPMNNHEDIFVNWERSK